MTRKLELALVGCGAICDWHRQALEEIPTIEITAAIDIDPERAQATAKRCNAQPFTSLEDGLAHGNFDAVDLMLPHHMHASVARQAFAAGRHVLLEKPMAPTLDACEEILEAAKKAGTVFMVGENAQYWPEIKIARDLIQAGAIGEVVTARVSLFYPPMAMYYGAHDAWRLDRAAAGGGLAIDTGSHYIRPLRMWFGEIEEVIGAMGRPYERMQGESLLRSLFRFRSGLIVSFDLLLSAAPISPQNMFRITGTKGEIVIGAKVLLYDADHRGGIPVQPEIPQGYMRSYAGEFNDFASAVLHGTPLAAGPESSLAELRTALALERSARTKCWENIWT